MLSFPEEPLYSDSRDFVDEYTEKMAIETAKEMEFKILLGCHDCGLRLFEWNGEIPMAPRGYIVEEPEREAEVYCKSCYRRRFE